MGENEFDARIEAAYKEHLISCDDYEFMLAEETLDEASTDRCHEIMVKIGLLRRVAEG